MSSAEPPSRRRNHSDIDDDDEDADDRSSNSSPNRSGNKRVRTNGPASDSESPEPEPEQSRIHSDDDDDDQASDAEGRSEFQPGSIRRVKLTNFVTYERAEFFPGPNLNMVIGPNGTGKSSLVCAICLGLGLSPKLLGRADDVGEFVKHNTSVAEVEIELERLPRDPNNYVIRSRFIRDGNKREYLINGKNSTLKAVLELTKRLSIQIDNLCQFLPQDKVSEFAGLSPVELLLQTQRAAAPEEMLLQHEQLKKRRKEQKGLEEEKERDQEALESMENRQQNLRAEVQRLQERQEVLRKVMVLKKRRPFVEYRIARDAHLLYKKKKTDAQARLRVLKERVEPILATVHRKEANRDLTATVVREREQAVKGLEQEAGNYVKEFDAIDEETKKIEGAVQGEKATETARKAALIKIQRRISELEAKLQQEEPLDFDAAEWNNRIANVIQEAREIGHRSQQAREEYARMVEAVKQKQLEKERTTRELEQFNSAEGQRVTKLDKLSHESGQGWKWLQEHQKEFEKEVYGPPLVTCSIKDPQYVNLMESLFGKTDMTAFTVQSSADYTRLRQGLLTTLNLADITIKQTSSPLLEYARPRHSEDAMRRLGFEHWALDLIDGPEPVLAMLCHQVKLNTTAVGLKESDDSQHAMILESGITNWVTGNTKSRYIKRAEYGPGATSVSTNAIKAATQWSNTSIDVSKRDEIQARITGLDERIAQMKVEARPVKAIIDGCKEQLNLKGEEETKLKEEKAAAQRAYAYQQSLPGKITAEKENEAAKQNEGLEMRQRIEALSVEHDSLVLRKARTVLKQKDVITKLRLALQELIEAKIRLIETKSDIASLNERNQDITNRVAREEALVSKAEADSKKVKDVATRAHAVCTEIRNDPDFDSIAEEVGNPDPEMTVDILDHEIAAEESKLEFIHETNPNAIRDFEARQKDVENMQDKIANRDARLQKLEKYIHDVRSKWEPELDRLIGKISDAFSFNFEQIGCAGEVNIHKDEDFELWAIQIKVKFRENETLQILNQQRQSGGERSVSTIFYLMSLQSMARAPFRVVDEINQGMDPRNERMVHERMVEIACKEHTSQYFLITPKLLTGLRYDKRMKVLCIASGEHMPEDYKKLDIARIVGIQRAIMATG